MHGLLSVFNRVKVGKLDVRFTFEWLGNLRWDFHRNKFLFFSKFGEIYSITVCFMSE
jgi:hypothetical protein